MLFPCLIYRTQGFEVTCLLCPWTFSQRSWKGDMGIAKVYGIDS